MTEEITHIHIAHPIPVRASARVLEGFSKEDLDGVVLSLRGHGEEPDPDGRFGEPGVTLNSAVRFLALDSGFGNADPILIDLGPDGSAPAHLSLWLGDTQIAFGRLRAPGPGEPCIRFAPSAFQLRFERMP